MAGNEIQIHLQKVEKRWVEKERLWGEVHVCVLGGGGGGGSLVTEGAGIEYLFAESLLVSYHFCSRPNAVCLGLSSTSL